MNDIEMTMLTGYPSMDYLNHEKSLACCEPLVKPKYDDANALFDGLFEEEGIEDGSSAAV